MAFRTKLDYSDNRQIKQRERTSTTLSGSTTFGVPYSALTNGIDTSTSGTTEIINTIAASTFSGNGTTTIFTWYDPRMALAESEFSAITNLTSGITQESGILFTVNTTGTTQDGYDYNETYSGLSFSFTVNAIYSGAGPVFSGTVQSDDIEFYSASSLDYTGRTIWVDNPEITRTNRLIITDNPMSGYVWTCIDSEGMGEWQYNGSSSGNTLSEVLINGNTTGNNWIEVEPGRGLRNVNPSGDTKQIVIANTGIASAVVSNVSSSTTEISQTNNSFSINGEISVFPGATYVNDFSANYTNRSLVDKEYVDNQITGVTDDILFSAGTGTNSITNIGDGSNVVTGLYAFSMGKDNEVNGNYSSAIGEKNIVDTDGSHILSDTGSIYSIRSGILAGTNNIIKLSAQYSVILGGSDNNVYSTYSGILGGLNNNIGTTTGGLGAFSTILGGVQNTIGSNSQGSSIIGGLTNEVNSNRSAILGGQNNIVSGTYGVILGGDNNSVTNQEGSIIGCNNNSVTRNRSSILGGRENISSQSDGAIIGGTFNTISGVSKSNSVIIGGDNNTITGSYSSILGGLLNTVSGDNSVIVGGSGINGVNDNTVYMNNLFVTQNNEGHFYTDLDGGAGSLVSLSGSSKLPRFAMSVGTGGVGTGAGGSIGVRAWDDVTYTPYGQPGDMHIYAGVSSNGLNIISADGSGGAEDYIRFYAGRSANMGGDADIHIQGTGLTTQGYVGFDTESPTQRIDVNGNGRFRNIGSNASSGALHYDANGVLTTNTSDMRMKDQIITIESALDKVKQLRGVYYKWKEDLERGVTGNTRVGFIAQEVKNVVPELAFTNERTEDKLMGVHYQDITALLVEAIKELVSSGSPLFNRTELILETQTIAAEDNNIELNFNGTHDSALNGGITVIKGIDNDTHSEFMINSDGDWNTNNYILPHGLVLPEFTPTSTNDASGKLGEVTRDDQYLYIKTNDGWKRTGLETF